MVGKNKNQEFLYITLSVIVAVIVIIAAVLLVGNNQEPDEFNRFPDKPGNGGFDRVDDNNNNNENSDSVDLDIENTFEPANVPDLDTSKPSTDQPVYLFLFTHTEDPFNHELSEERYTRLAPELARIAEANPEADITWTIQFIGADAKTVADRDSETGVATMLKDYSSQGHIDFGYHGHHDPTYLNRPQKEMNEFSTWEEMVEGMVQWTSCEKNLPYGGCEVPGEGGLMAIANNFGDVKVVSGAGIELGVIEGDVSAHAIRKYLPNRMLGFGFSDHGATSTVSAYQTAQENLFDALTPTYETSLTIFWMDDVLRINDAGHVLNDGSLRLMDGIDEIKNSISFIDSDRPQVLNAGFATKYIYTSSSTSPTKYGYSNPESPELPDSLIVDEAQRDVFYDNELEGLEYLATEFLDEHPGSKFVDGDEIIEMYAPDEYFTISDEQLDVLSRWLLLNTDDELPDYVSDGENFYSLRDLLVSLSFAIADDFPNSVELHRAYGPTEEISPSSGVTITSAAIIDFAEEIANNVELAESRSWEVTPKNILASEYSTESGNSINTAQLLYSFAYYYAANFAGEDIEGLNVPTISAMPTTLSYLENMDCYYCQGSSWSLKPAKIYN